MTRFIEIQDEEENKLLTTDDLPIVVYLIENDERLIKLDALENFNKNENIFACAYLAEDEGHLFLQPESFDNKIFHNDEWITKSVWIKSGDIIAINDRLILFKISGDRIEIKLIDKSKTTLLSPPPIEQLLVHKSNENLDTDQSHFIRPGEEKSGDSNPAENRLLDSIKKKIIYSILTILLVFVIFLLMAESISIKTDPVIKDLKIKGLFPTFKINDRYIALNGEYQVSGIKEGYKELNKTIHIDEENKDFIFTLKENPGFIKFDIRPIENNKIYINNTLLGAGVNNDNKIIEYEVDKGEYQLKIVNPRYKIYKQKIKIEGKNKSQIFKPVLIPNWGQVRINTVPSEANTTIKLKNNIIKQSLTTPVEVELIEGQYEIIIEKEKYKKFINTIDIVSQEINNLKTINLEPKEAILEITSTPEEALIQINGNFYGKTPLIVKLPSLKEYEVEISTQGYQTRKETIKLAADEQHKLNYELIPQAGTVFISTSPKQAKLYINGVLQSQSNGRFVLNGKNKTIMVKAEGYISQTKKISINDYSKSLTFQLKKKNSVSKSNKIKPEKIIPKKIKSANINSIGLRMIRVKGQIFTMGSPKNERGRRTNELEHKVNLNYDFYLSDKEISNKLFKKFKSTHNSGSVFGRSLDTAHQPVVNVSWNEAAQFANWLSRKEGLTPYYKEMNGKMIPVSLKEKNNGYRLPFEAEWELAARGLEGKKYSWGYSYPPKVISGNFADESVSNHLANVIPDYNDKNKVTSISGYYDANESGFYDFGGNVSEWCQDYFSPMMSSSMQINPTGPEKGTHKVVRGSSWKDSSITDLRLSYRGYSQKGSDDIGFRLARYVQ